MKQVAIGDSVMVDSINGRCIGLGEFENSGKMILVEWRLSDGNLTSQWFVDSRVQV